MKASASVRSELSELNTALRSYRQGLVSVAAFSFVSNILMLTPSIYMMQVFDRVMSSRNVTTLLMLTIIALGLYVLQALLDLFRSIALARIGARLDMQMNKRIFGATFERCLRGARISPTQALYDLSTVRQALTGPGLLALLDAVWIPVFIAVNFLFSPVLGIFFMGGAVLLALMTWLTERMSKSPMDAAQKLGMQSNQIIGSHMRNVEVIEAMGMLENIRTRWFDIHCRYINAQSLATDRTSIFSAITKFVRVANQSLIMGIGVLEVLEGRMSSGMMMASSMLVGRAMLPVEMLISNWKGLNSALSAYRRLNELLAQYPERPRSMSLPEPMGSIVLENLAAVAPGSKTLILSNITLTIPAGATVAVVGPSASGKSTLARLLVGVWSAAVGTVRLDGAELSHWNKEELGLHIGYLPQDIELFDGTIAENIGRFGAPNPEKIIEAARRAGMHEAILRFPKAYDTPLGDAGSFLSGGQRQRIGLARALYGDPKLVILDEPNSNLDDTGEQALVDALIDLKKRNRTVVLITHRLSTLSVVDLVMAMADGNVKLYGPRDQVIAALSRKPLPVDSSPVTPPNATEPA